MPGIRVDASKAKELLAQAPRRLERAVGRFLLLGGQFTAGAMRAAINRSVTGHGTGQTAASVTYRVHADRAEVFPATRTTKWGVFDPVWLDQDTRPHEIRPRFAKSLAFARAGSSLGQRGGSMVSVFRFGRTASGRPREVVSGLVYARSVRHPGTKGKRFVEATVGDVEKPLHGLLDRLVGEELKDLSRGGG